jgi:hypothetical protein
MDARMTCFVTVWRAIAEIPPQETLPFGTTVILANNFRIDFGMFDDATRRWTWHNEIALDGACNEPAVFTLIDFPKFPRATT